MERPRTHCLCVLPCLLLYSANKPFSRDSSYLALYSILGTKKGLLVLNQDHTDISFVARKWSVVQWLVAVGVGWDIHQFLSRLPVMLQWVTYFRLSWVLLMPFLPSLPSPCCLSQT